MCCEGWALTLRRRQLIFFLNIQGKYLNLMLWRGQFVQFSILQGWDYSDAYIDVTFLRSHTWNSVCTVLLPFLTTGGAYLSLFFLNLTTKPHKVSSCPGNVLLYVHQPSFYRIMNLNHKTGLYRTVTTHMKCVQTAVMVSNLKLSVLCYMPH